MIFRVHGVRADGSNATVDIECESEAIARNEAVRHGLANTTSVEIISGERADSPVRPARPRPDPTALVSVQLTTGSLVGLSIAVASGLITAFIGVTILSLIFGGVLGA